MCVGAVLFPKLERLFMGKLADDLRPKCEHAHPDQRLEISLLGLFSYDRFSTVLPEKGWILPLPSYLSKPVATIVLQRPVRPFLACIPPGRPLLLQTETVCSLCAVTLKI